MEGEKVPLGMMIFGAIRYQGLYLATKLVLCQEIGSVDGDLTETNFKR